jgi:hypothetical protein
MITGAGVLLISDDKVILGLDRNNKLTEFGGRIDSIGSRTEHPYEAASRELFEESRGKFYVSPQKLKTCQSIKADHVSGRVYQCYICHQKVDIKTFKLPMRGHIDPCFREMVGVIAMSKPGLLEILRKNPNKIHPRLRAIIKKLIK